MVNIRVFLAFRTHRGAAGTRARTGSIRDTLLSSFCHTLLMRSLVRKVSNCKKGGAVLRPFKKTTTLKHGATVGFRVASGKVGMGEGV